MISLTPASFGIFALPQSVSTRPEHSSRDHYASWWTSRSLTRTPCSQNPSFVHCGYSLFDACRITTFHHHPGPFSKDPVDKPHGPPQKRFWPPFWSPPRAFWDRTHGQPIKLVHPILLYIRAGSPLETLTILDFRLKFITPVD